MSECLGHCGIKFSVSLAAKAGVQRPEDQDLGVCDTLSPIQEPKWKSWLKYAKPTSSLAWF